MSLDKLLAKLISETVVPAIIPNGVSILAALNLEVCFCAKGLIVSSTNFPNLVLFISAASLFASF